MPMKLPGPKTETQSKAEIKDSEIPPCEGNPNAPCRMGASNVVLKGYDDRFRCPACNRVHIELVMKEAGESPPGSTPIFVAPKLDAKATAARMARVRGMLGRMEQVGHEGGGNVAPVETPAAPPVDEVRPVDIEAISDEDRRASILAKYARRRDGGKL